MVRAGVAGTGIIDITIEENLPLKDELPSEI
jgi:hypothetical protein